MHSSTHITTYTQVHKCIHGHVQAMLGLETASLHTSTTHTHTHTQTHHALLSLICTFMRTKFVLGWSIYVTYIALSIHEHREPQRRNELMPHLTHTTSLCKGTKYVHISLALQQICGENAGQLKSEHCSSTRRQQEVGLGLTTSAWGKDLSADTRSLEAPLYWSRVSLEQEKTILSKNGHKHAQNPFTIVQQFVQVQQHSYTLVAYGVRAIIPFSVYATSYMIPCLYTNLSCGRYC